MSSASARSALMLEKRLADMSKAAGWIACNRRRISRGWAGKLASGRRQTRFKGAHRGNQIPPAARLQVHCRLNGTKHIGAGARCLPRVWRLGALPDWLAEIQVEPCRRWILNTDRQGGLGHVRLGLHVQLNIDDHSKLFHLAYSDFGGDRRRAATVSATGCRRCSRSRRRRAARRPMATAACRSRRWR